MTIHHATVKRAASLGIVLTEENGVAVAFHTERARRVANTDPKVAVFLATVAAALAVEHPHIVIGADDEPTASVDGEAFWHLDDLADEEGEQITDLTTETALEAALAMITDAAPEGEDVEDEEEPEGKVVVAQRYKDEYKARGDASGCGDWLHVTLKRYSSDVTVEGKKTTVFDEPGFTAMLIANGVKFSDKFAAMPESGSKGWEGRYRMNGRQMLEGPLLRAKGVLQLENGTSVVMPDEDYDALLNQKRHNSLREELETAEAEADAEAEKAAKPKRTRKAK